MSTSLIPLKNISLSINDQVASLTFDRVDSNANIFDLETLEELSKCLDYLEKIDELNGLIIESQKPKIFMAGADLKTLFSASEADVSAMIELGQDCFNRLASLSCITVAKIHGACLGGGYELALACDWRVASTASCTKIGLPETQLGILPAWGGSTRLPRLIGLDNALPLILSGKVLPPVVAYKKGLVDSIVEPEHLDKEVSLFIAKKRSETNLPWWKRSLLFTEATKSLALKNLRAKTKGLYPGPERATEVVCSGIRKSTKGSLALEKDAINDLIQRPETKNLIQLFFAKEAAKKLGLKTKPTRPITNITVVGAGVMGAGIAYWLTSKGFQVLLKDVNHKALAKGVKRVEDLYQAAAKRKVLSKIDARKGFDRLHASTENLSLTSMDLIIEAATENLELKKKIFATLSKQIAPHTLLATNTSALPIKELASVVKDPSRLIGLHFFNPVHRMPLIEVVRCETTSEETLETILGLTQRLGKTPVVVQDSPGFLVNRVLMPYIVEAVKLFETGICAHRIDEAMVNGGMPMGPLRLLDEVGLDVGLHVAETLAKAFPDRVEIPEVLKKLVSEGCLGRKSGSGIYTYDVRSKGKKNKLTLNPVASKIVTSSKSDLDIGAHLFLTMEKEAQLCLNEGIVDSATNVNLAMILGSGYPPCKGGPLAWS